MSIGADPTIVNERGHRPAMYAKDSSIRDLLAEAESKVCFHDRMLCRNITYISQREKPTSMRL